MKLAQTFKLKGYEIQVGNLTETFPAWFQKQHFSKTVIIADQQTAKLCLPVFEEKTGLRNLPIIEIPAGETHKNLETCQKIWQKMLAMNLDRRALALNLGGGTIGDMGGFCAATFKRGIPFVQVPTTLLAMTDAGIGGKLGIDYQGVKNVVGVFRNPSAVFCDTDFLKTLPERELKSGLAEVIKHAAIGDPFLWNLILKELQPATPFGNISNFLPRSIAVKVRAVKKDPLENGLRQILNFGHTIGHALESFFLKTENTLTHGEAVAIGMVAEMHIFQKLKNGDNALTAKRLSELGDLILKIFDPIEIPQNASPEIWKFMQNDKKNFAGKVRIAVPTDGKMGMEILEVGEKDVFESLFFEFEG